MSATPSLSKTEDRFTLTAIRTGSPSAATQTSFPTAEQTAKRSSTTLIAVAIALTTFLSIAFVLLVVCTAFHHRKRRQRQHEQMMQQLEDGTPALQQNYFKPGPVPHIIDLHRSYGGYHSPKQSPISPKTSALWANSPQMNFTPPTGRITPSIKEMPGSTTWSKNEKLYPMQVQAAATSGPLDEKRTTISV